MLPSNVAGRTKKSITATGLFIGYCAGNATGAQLFREKDAPDYIPGLTGCAVVYGIEVMLMSLWRTWYWYQNKRRDNKVLEMGLSPEECGRMGMVAAEEDMTDFENVYVKSKGQKHLPTRLRHLLTFCF